MRAKVAEAEAEQLIAQRRNEIRRVAAELEAEAKAIEERAEAGALAAQATAMQALEAVRRELEAVRLQSDVVIPAEIQQEASALEAAGAAASIAENGRATAESLSLVSQTWMKAGASAQDMFLINKIEDITRIVVEGVQRVQVGTIQLIDSDGQALPRLAASYPAAVAAVLRSLFETTGVDITALLARGRPATACPACRHRRDRCRPDRLPARARRCRHDRGAVAAGRPGGVRLRADDGGEEPAVHLPAQRGADLLGRPAGRGQRAQGRLPDHQGRAGHPHPAVRDRRPHGSDQHAHRGAGAERLLQGGHPAERARHRQREGGGRAAGAGQRHRALPGGGPGQDHGGRQGDPGGQPARRAGHA